MPKIKGNKKSKSSIDSRQNMAANERANEEFKDFGFNNLNKPSSSNKPPTMPTEFESMKSPSLGNLMAEYSAWKEYTQEKHTLELNKLTMLKEEYDFEYAKKLAVQKGNNITEKKALLMGDKELYEKRQAVTEQEMLVELLSSRAESFTDAISIISREITRRGQIGINAST